MSDAGELTLRPLPAPWYVVVPGLCWVITLGDPPTVLAVCRDADIAERIHDLIVEHNLVDTDALLDGGR